MYVLSLVIALAAVLVLLVVAATLLGPARRAAKTAQATRLDANPRLAILRLSLAELKAERSRRRAAKTGQDRTDPLRHA